MRLGTILFFAKMRIFIRWGMRAGCFRFDEWKKGVFTDGMRLTIGLICLMMLAGCAHSKSRLPDKPIPTPTAPVLTPDLRPVGRIQAVNEKGRFVIISFPLTNVPESGRVLNIYRGGLKIGVVKITGPQREGNTVADILFGEALVGDEVRED